MNPMNRRELCVALSSFAALAMAAEAQSAQAQSTERGLPELMAVPPPPGSPGDPVLDKPKSFRFSELPVVKTANGETRAVIRGVLPTGEAIELHETTLLPGHMPHPPHKHRHSELMMVREGNMEFENDGKPEPVGPGGVIFAASNVMHGLKNIGTTNANYFVIAIGQET
jgi:quercetin dioxygenase-like cupin family protein